MFIIGFGRGHEPLPKTLKTKGGDMLNARRIILTALALSILPGAAPVMAQVDGLWAGRGTGHTHPPIPIPLYIEAWKYWEGVIEGERFAGEWCDDFEHGYFEGTITYSSPVVAECRGEWYWVAANGQPYLMGPFIMVFLAEEERCEGKWEVYHDDDVGGMEGRKIR